MSELLKKYPVPITGLILGLASAGNLIQSYGNLYKNILGLISGLLFILMVAKMMKYPKGVKESLDNPVIGSVFPTFSMAIMILSTYLKPFSESLACIMWIIGVVMHGALILWFTNKFVVNFNIKKVFPSWFIVYVGIVVASVSAPAYNATTVGKIIFWFGFVTYIIVLPMVIYRIVKVKEIPEQVLPTLVTLAAPASLLLAGYMNSFEVKNTTMVWILVLLSTIMYAISLVLLPKLLKLKFYPSYSAFTFPLIISAIAMKATNGFLVKIGQTLSILGYLAKFQEIIGVSITLYVLGKYVLFVIPESKGVLNAKTKAQ